MQTAAVADGQPRVVALDPATGEPAWQTKFAERAPYTSPLAATLAGVPQVLVHHAVVGPPSIGGLTAIDPGTGSVMWTQTPAASKAVSFETPLLLGGDRVALLTWNDVTAQQVKREGGAWRMDELWRSGDLSASIAPPVLHEGHLYGFGGDDLACVEAATGKVAWKQRLYGGSAILVDGHLVVLSSASGEVRIVEATPAAYREKAQARRAGPWGPLGRPAQLRGRPHLRPQRRGAGRRLDREPAVARPTHAQSQKRRSYSPTHPALEPPEFD